MDDMRLKFYTPVVTGMLQAPQKATAAHTAECDTGESFQEILKRQLQDGSGVSFSKHAVKRAIENNIEMDDDSLGRLGEGVKLAERKNLDDTLILVGGTAFLVNVKNNMVITAVNSRSMKGNVFTNIDGTVIV